MTRLHFSTIRSLVQSLIQLPAAVYYSTFFFTASPPEHYIFVAFATCSTSSSVLILTPTNHVQLSSHSAASTHSSYYASLTTVSFTSFQCITNFSVSTSLSITTTIDPHNRLVHPHRSSVTNHLVPSPIIEPTRRCTSIFPINRQSLRYDHSRSFVARKPSSPSPSLGDIHIILHLSFFLTSTPSSRPRSPHMVPRTFVVSPIVLVLHT